jgi:predicted amidophosphoribosyltransferase
MPASATMSLSTAPSVGKRPWTTEGLLNAVTDGWFERDALALFMYMDSRDLVLDFKDGHPDAVAEVLAWFRGTTQQNAGELRRRDCRYIVSAPRHSVGPARASAEELCRELAASIPGLQHLPGALVRTRAVTSGFHDGLRSTEDQHLATIRYAGPNLGEAAGGFILFDDVYTSGATSRASRTVLMRAGAKTVLSLFITKTSAHRAWQPTRGVVQRRGGPPSAKPG